MPFSFLGSTAALEMDRSHGVKYNHRTRAGSPADLGTYGNMLVEAGVASSDFFREFAAISRLVLLARVSHPFWISPSSYGSK